VAQGKRRTSTTSALSGHSLETWLTFVGNDPESVVFREDLDKVLTAAGVKTKFFSGYAMAVGLKILGGTAEQRALFLKAFQDAGLPLLESAGGGMMKGQLEILVGTKPPPEFPE